MDIFSSRYIISIFRRIKQFLKQSSNLFIWALVLLLSVTDRCHYKIFYLRFRVFYINTFLQLRQFFANVDTLIFRNHFSCSSFAKSQMPFFIDGRKITKLFASNDCNNYDNILQVTTNIFIHSKTQKYLQQWNRINGL